MTRRRLRIALLAVVAVILVLATIHFTINGFPELGSLNPHAK
ncbi:hypothetical protein [Sinomonas sp. G460-2]